jgi:hypothetical protein
MGRTKKKEREECFMSRRETMRLSAAQEATQWEDEEQPESENQSEPPGQLTELGRQMKELDARQARIETHLIKLMPSARKAEEQFATTILAGKELRDEMAEHRRDIATSLTQYQKQVTATAEEIGGEFKQQLQILQSFFDGVLKLSEKNEQMVDRCQDMVATSSAIYHKGSAGVSEMSEKTQAHLKDAAEAYRKRIEAQAEHFDSVFGRLSKLLIVGTVVILLTACVAWRPASSSSRTRRRCWGGAASTTRRVWRSRCTTPPARMTKFRTGLKSRLRRPEAGYTPKKKPARWVNTRRAFFMMWFSSRNARPHRACPKTRGWSLNALDFVLEKQSHGTQDHP